MAVPVPGTSTKIGLRISTLIPGRVRRGGGGERADSSLEGKKKAPSRRLCVVGSRC